MDAALLQELEDARKKFYELRAQIATDFSSEATPDLATAMSYYMSIISDGITMLKGESNKFRAHLGRVIQGETTENKKAFQCMEDLIDISLRALNEVVIQSERIKV